MRCPSCQVEVREGQKFCMECGASLRGISDVTGEVPVVRAADNDSSPDDTTHPLAIVPPPPRAAVVNRTDVTAPIALSPAPVLAAPGRRTDEIRVVEATSSPVDLTAQLPAAARTGELPEATPPQQWQEQWPATGPIVPVAVGQPRSRFRFRPLLVVAALAAVATAMAVFTTLVRVTPAPDGRSPDFTVNDLGTNNTVAGLLTAGALVVGALLWCLGLRWGAGLAGGAGAALAGWAALLLGATQWWPIGAAAPDADVGRSIGYWALWAAAGLGLVALFASLRRSGRDRRGGLDPWIAALGAVSFIIAAGGPLIPEGTADWSNNWSAEGLGVDLPPAFFVGRAVQLGLLLLCGVVGCLLVRRWGLGLAIGGGLAAGWLLVTAATERTRSPIGPAYDNPGSLDLRPHAVTVVGFALAGFFCLVAVVLALLDTDR